MSIRGLYNLKVEEWRSGDYRTVACILRPLDEILNGMDIDYLYFVQQGLGRTKSAAFLLEYGQQFYLAQYLDLEWPLTEILVYFGEGAKMYSDLDMALSHLSLDRSDLEFIYTF